MDTETTTETPTTETESHPEITVVVEATPAPTPVAPKAKKARKARKPKRPTWPSLSGQTGPDIQVPYAALNAKQRRVLAAADVEGRKPMHLSDLADLAFAGKANKAKRNSWVRNSLRALVRGGWMEKTEVSYKDDDGETQKTDRGMYHMTKSGKDRLRRLSAPARTKTESPAQQDGALAEIPGEVATTLPVE